MRKVSVTYPMTHELFCGRWNWTEKIKPGLFPFSLDSAQNLSTVGFTKLLNSRWCCCWWRGQSYHEQKTRRLSNKSFIRHLVKRTKNFSQQKNTLIKFRKDKCYPVFAKVDRKIIQPDPGFKIFLVEYLHSSLE